MACYAREKDTRNYKTGKTLLEIPPDIRTAIFKGLEIAE
jgi:hypothetical protein